MGHLCVVVPMGDHRLVGLIEGIGDSISRVEWCGPIVKKHIGSVRNFAILRRTLSTSTIIARGPCSIFGNLHFKQVTSQLTSGLKLLLVLYHLRNPFFNFFFFFLIIIYIEIKTSENPWHKWDQRLSLLSLHDLNIFVMWGYQLENLFILHCTQEHITP